MQISEEQDGYKSLDFIGLGCTRSGTTWVLENMMEHPEVCVPKQRELCYFGKNPMLGFISNWDRSREWLEKAFSHCIPGQKKGELNTLYLSDESSPALIQERAKDAKLIVIFRNPTDRLLSLYHMIDRISGVGQNFEQFIEDRQDVVSEGFYSIHLSKFLEVFSIDQFHFILFDDIRSAPKNVMRDLFEFLEIDKDFVPAKLAERINVGGRKSSRLMPIIIGAIGGWLKSNALGRWVVRKLYDTGVYGIARRASGRNDNNSYPSMSPQAKARLNDLYREDIKCLSEILGRDLSHWSDN